MFTSAFTFKSNVKSNLKGSFLNSGIKFAESLLEDNFADQFYRARSEVVGKDKLVVEFDAPGCKKNDVKVNFTKLGVITVEMNCETQLLKETKKFEFSLNSDFDPTTLSANLVDGVLTLSFWRKNSANAVGVVEVK